VLGTDIATSNALWPGVRGRLVTRVEQEVRNHTSPGAGERPGIPGTCVPVLGRVGRISRDTFVKDQAGGDKREHASRTSVLLLGFLLVGSAITTAVAWGGYRRVIGDGRSGGPCREC